MKDKLIDVLRNTLKPTTLDEIRARHAESNGPYRRIRGDVATCFDIVRGSVRRFERPTDPVGENDWEASR
jgi:hypothetical protein